MKQQVCLLVSCSSTKIYSSTNTSSDTIQLQDYFDVDHQKMLVAWKDAIAQYAATKYRGDSIYGGQYWAKIREIQKYTQSRLCIVSAGLGFVQQDQMIPLYDATFSRGTPNSIPSSVSASTWFAAMSGYDNFVQTFVQMENPFLVVLLSEVYVQAMEPCLSWFVQQFSSQHIVIIGTEGLCKRFPQLAPMVILVNERMTHVVGGRVGILIPSVFLWYVQNHTMDNPLHIRRTVEKLARQTESLESKIHTGGTKKNDAEILEWLKDLFEKEPSISKKQALQQFRIDYKCEEKRFYNLFTQQKNSI